MRVLERARFEEIMEDDDGEDLMNIEGDNALNGLLIIRKYLPKEGIEGAEHDIIYSVGVRELLDAGLIEEDAIELRRNNWMIEDDALACYV